MIAETESAITLAPSPPLTHAELVDAFPAIVGTRTGFDEGKLTGINDFGMASEARTPNARACCVIVLSLLNGCGCSLGYCLGAMDAEHKAAFAQLIVQVVERGIAT